MKTDPKTLAELDQDYAWLREQQASTIAQLRMQMLGGADPLELLGVTYVAVLRAVAPHPDALQRLAIALACSMVEAARKEVGA